MRSRRDFYAKSKVSQSQRRTAAAAAGRTKQDQPKSRRQVDRRNVRAPFAPPEDWHEPTGRNDYRIVVQNPGEGYRHVVTPAEVKGRLLELPAEFLRDLEVVQLSRMTRKKQSFPCYGMQWGPALYLYPLETGLVEHFERPPAPAIVNESKMFGGRWDQPSPGCWTLTWTAETIRDFYLNNILIHELGHLLDERNTGYTDRERFAEWFAIEFGYRPTGGGGARGRKVRRRHHSS